MVAVPTEGESIERSRPWDKNSALGVQLHPPRPAPEILGIASPRRARAKEPVARFPLHVCFVSSHHSEPSPFLSPSRCILRSCVIRPTPTPDLGHLRAKRLRCTFTAGALPCPGCAHASGLLPRPPRAMRCEPALCCSMIASASSPLTGATPTSSAPWPWR